jgi:CubicO group peptidase (beta-lactamase class C family)
LTPPTGEVHGSATIALGVRRLTGFGHVGLGGSFGWAIPAAGVAFAMVRNRLLAP